MEVEHGSFTPLVFTTTGVMGQECARFHKSLAEKLSTKKNERYSEVMQFLRVKLSHMALRSTLLCLRGSRPITEAFDSETEDFGLALGDMGLGRY